ncbi:MAG: rRNA maturation RNase YbeY [Lactobacillus sp.]|nr:rRNA maturation RNase YbeY [Lactobacillus sp.]
MTSHFINIFIEDTNWASSLANAEKLAQKASDAVFDNLYNNWDMPFLGDKPVVVNLSLSNDKHIKELNKTYRKKDKPTNVLSFALIDDENFEQNCEIFDEIELGDIIISIDTLKKEAAEKNIKLEDHFTHLFIHGLLHLSGFDHIEDEEAEEMEALEIDILSNLNINNPYE